MGAFRSTKISCGEWNSIFPEISGWLHQPGYTEAFHSVLDGNLQQRDTGNRNLLPGTKFSVRPVQPKKVVHLGRWTFFSKHFVVIPNRSIQFWTEIFRNFVKWEVPKTSLLTIDKIIISCTLVQKH